MRVLLILVCLAVVAGMAFIFYANYVKGPSAERARESIEASKAKVRQESQRWRQRLTEFEEQARTISDEVMEGDRDTSGVCQRLEALRERIETARKEMGPSYEGQLRKWKGITEESLEELKKESGSANVKLKALLQEVSQSLRRSLEKVTEEAK